jgi:AbrB family looped-hinge helix DNA binding protein
MVAVRLDDKGRVSLPRQVREELGLEPGDTLFIERDGDTVRLAKALNPFTPAVREAMATYHAGRKIALKKLAARHGIADLDALENAIDDVIDTEALEKARAEAGEAVPVEELMRRYGIKP